MTKEFEAKKQALRELVYATDNKRKNLVPTANMRIKLSRAINDLQPPKPPACSTCKHTVPIYNMFKSKILWRECKKVKLFKSNSGNATELPTRGWGCSKHSDYGDAK